jgi:hypothetical protein
MNSIATTEPVTTIVMSKEAHHSLAWPICRCVLGVALLIAAILKAEELAALPMLGTGVLNQRWLLVCLLELEVVFGGWLLLAVGRFWTWAATFAVWLTFLGVAGYGAISGAESCGCFGRVQVNPWYTSVADLIVVLFLVIWRPRRSDAQKVTRWSAQRWTALIVITIAGAVFCIWNLSRYSLSRLSEDGISLSDGTVVLEPEKWAGQPFILANYIDVGSQLTRGDWIVLLYRYDCDHCRRAVPKYMALAEQKNESISSSFAFIQIPPFAPDGQELIRPSAAVTIGRLSGKWDWFSPTPVMVRLHNGSVQAVDASDTAEDPAASLAAK